MCGGKNTGMDGWREGGRDVPLLQIDSILDFPQAVTAVWEKDEVIVLPSGYKGIKQPCGVAEVHILVHLGREGRRQGGKAGSCEEDTKSLGEVRGRSPERREGRREGRKEAGREGGRGGGRVPT